MKPKIVYEGRKVRVNEPLAKAIRRAYSDIILEGTPRGGFTLITSEDERGDFYFRPSKDKKGWYDVSFSSRTWLLNLQGIAEKMNAEAIRLASYSGNLEHSERLAKRYLHYRFRGMKQAGFGKTIVKFTIPLNKRLKDVMYVSPVDAATVTFGELLSEMKRQISMWGEDRIESFKILRNKVVIDVLSYSDQEEDIIEAEEYLMGPRGNGGLLMDLARLEEGFGQAYDQLLLDKVKVDIL